MDTLVGDAHGERYARARADGWRAAARVRAARPRRRRLARAHRDRQGGFGVGVEALRCKAGNKGEVPAHAVRHLAVHPPPPPATPPTSATRRPPRSKGLRRGFAAPGARRSFPSARARRLRVAWRSELPDRVNPGGAPEIAAGSGAPLPADQLMISQRSGAAFETSKAPITFKQPTNTTPAPRSTTPPKRRGAVGRIVSARPGGVRSAGYVACEQVLCSITSPSLRCCCGRATPRRPPPPPPPHHRRPRPPRRHPNSSTSQRRRHRRPAPAAMGDLGDLFGFLGQPAPAAAAAAAPPPPPPPPPPRSPGAAAGRRDRARRARQRGRILDERRSRPCGAGRLWRRPRWHCRAAPPPPAAAPSLDPLPEDAWKAAVKWDDAEDGAADDGDGFGPKFSIEIKQAPAACGRPWRRPAALTLGGGAALSGGRPREAQLARTDGRPLCRRRPDGRSSASRRRRRQRSGSGVAGHFGAAPAGFGGAPPLAAPLQPPPAAPLQPMAAAPMQPMGGGVAAARDGGAAAAGDAAQPTLPAAARRRRRPTAEVGIQDMLAGRRSSELSLPDGSSHRPPNSSHRNLLFGYSAVRWRKARHPQPGVRRSRSCSRIP